jgi:hypothetical protein
MGWNWDIAILVAVALCQGATGYWAFHMSAQDTRARWGFGLVTATGIALIVWSGFRSTATSNHVETGITKIETTGDTNTQQLKAQTDLLATQGRLLDGQKAELADQDAQLKRIASAANVNPNQSAPALASAIVKRLADLDQRLHKVEYPPRDEHALYDGPAVAAQVSFANQPTADGAFTMTGLTSTAAFNFSKEYFFQTTIVKCESVPESATISFGAEAHHEYQNVPCKIVGKAPQ